MTIPGFSAEAALGSSAERNWVAWQVPGRSAHVFAQASQVILRRPFPLPFPDPCSACISDCLRRGGNQFSCRNLCSFLCF
jgi:hypothetical protein